MNPINASQMFSSMQQLASQAQGLNASGMAGGTPGADLVNPKEGGGFNAVLKNMVNHVNETQVDSSRMTNAYSRGDAGVDLSDAMVAMQKARVHFEAMVQVRNRLVNAYQEVMRMPV